MSVDHTPEVLILFLGINTTNLMRNIQLIYNFANGIMQTHFFPVLSYCLLAKPWHLLLFSSLVGSLLLVINSITSSKQTLENFVSTFQNVMDNVMYDIACQEKLFKGVEYTPKTPWASMQTKFRNQEKIKDRIWRCKRKVDWEVNKS